MSLAILVQDVLERPAGKRLAKTVRKAPAYSAPDELVGGVSFSAYLAQALLHGVPKAVGCVLRINGAL